MARKPNYRFERSERERAKAAKKAARLESKKAKAEQRRLGLEPGAEPELESDAGPTEDTPAES